jgi:signal transduction histidine kinase
MNPITQFFVDNLVLVYFFYGLAFFVLGLALLLADRQDASQQFLWAIPPLAGFGLLHAAHEWIVMFQLIRMQTSGLQPTVVEESLRVIMLAISFCLLLLFAHRLLSGLGWRFWIHLAWLPVILWMVGVALLIGAHGGIGLTVLQEIDVLARYCLGIPGAIVATVALMAQQRNFRAKSINQFGRDLVWCATALVLYGVVGQLFVHPTALHPSTWLNSALFLAWFGVPVQLFRALMAAVLAIFMWRVLGKFAREHARRIAAVVETEAAAREHALAVERRARAEESRLNIALQTQARELALLLDLSNLLATPVQIEGRLNQALRQIVAHFAFADAGLVLLLDRQNAEPQIAAAINLDDEPGEISAASDLARNLGIRCLAQGSAVCRHADGAEVFFDLDAVVIGQQCWEHASPTVSVAFPLAGQVGTGGALVLTRHATNRSRLELADLRLLAAIGHQIGLSVENANLFQDLQARERLLGNMLHQVVHVQEAERQRIARELHDATGQSLSAITLGLRGIEAALTDQAPDLLRPLETVYGFANEALIELRRLISDLRPPQLDDLGLGAALQWYVQSVQARHPQIKIKLVPPNVWPRLSPERETLIFRIVQESLNNATRHAQADTIQVVVTESNDQLQVRILDNGCGFPVAHALGRQVNAWGLLGMRERAQLMGGAVEINSTVGKGTEIIVTTPVEHDARSARATAPQAQKV